MPQLNRVIKNAKLTEIRRKLFALEDLNSYISGDFGLSEADFLSADVTSSDDALLFEAKDDKNEEDLLNAIMLHKRFDKIDPAKAADLRLWTYTAYHVCPDYVRRRWPIPYADLDAQSEDVKKKELRKIVSHWLFGTATDRALRRNALARLWWAAYVTYKPWEADTELGAFKKEDPYFYTRILFTTQDIYAQSMERAFGRDRKVLICMLDLFSKYPRLMERACNREFLILVNINCGFKVLGGLTITQITALMEELKNKVFAMPAPDEKGMAVSG